MRSQKLISRDGKMVDDVHEIGFGNIRAIRDFRMVATPFVAFPHGLWRGPSSLRALKNR